MRALKTKRFKTKDGFVLAVVLDTKAKVEELLDLKSVALLARRDLIALERNLKHHPIRRKIIHLLGCMRKS